VSPIILPPSGLTLAEYRARVIAHGVDAQKSDGITAAINTARDDVFSNRRWSFLEERISPVVTTPGSDSISLTALLDVSAIDAVRISDSAGLYALDYVPPGELAGYAVGDNLPDVPEFWTLQGGEIRFWPTPNKAYAVELDVLTSPPALVNEDDACPIPRAHANVVVWGALSTVLFRQRDWNAASYAAQQRDQRLAKMASVFGLKQRQSSSRVGVSGWNQDAAR